MMRVAHLLAVAALLLLEQKASGAERDEIGGSRKRRERIIVTLDTPLYARPEILYSRQESRICCQSRLHRGCTRIDLASVDCIASLGYPLHKVQHCQKSDSLIIEASQTSNQTLITEALHCLANFIDKDLDSIETDATVQISSEFSSNQWHVSAISAFGATGVNAWDFTQGNNDVVVAVIDTGVDYNHPDLLTNMWINTGEILGNGIDDDGNGFVDDVFGYDFVNDDGDPRDDNGHGTHCAGIIGGAVNVDRRVSGISPNVRVMAIKAIDAEGNGRLSDVISAIEYSLDMGAQITSNSFSSSDIVYSPAFNRLLTVIEKAGQLYVSAAGNKNRNTDKAPEFPASLDSPMILSVAATTKDDHLASFSNYGQQSIDVAAPGVNILSTRRSTGYSLSYGTSTATPLVSATAALVLSTISRHSHSIAGLGLETKDIILKSADKIPELQNKTRSGGRLNAARAVALATSRYAQLNPPIADDSLSECASLSALLIGLTYIVTLVGVDWFVGF